ncbi:putative heat shock protein, partial [Baffinella frigidus]
LCRECENAKRTLSSQAQVTVEVEGIKNGKDLSERLSRAKFEELNLDLFKKTLTPVQNVLRDAGMAKKEVHEIILVGGSTRIPKVRQLLKDFFNGKEPSNAVNPDEAVAFGATVQGGLCYLGLDMVLLDVTPLTLGIQTTGDIMTAIIDRNQACLIIKVFTTEVDNQPNVAIQVFQGERQFCKDNMKLGGFTLGPLPPAPRGVPQIDVGFHLDANGILFVTAQDLGTKKKETITISNSKGRMSEDEIERMIRDSKKFEDQDKKAKAKMEARQGIENLIRYPPSHLKP